MACAFLVGSFRVSLFHCWRPRATFFFMTQKGPSFAPQTVAETRCQDEILLFWKLRKHSKCHCSYPRDTRTTRVLKPIFHASYPFTRRAEDTKSRYRTNRSRGIWRPTDNRYAHVSKILSVGDRRSIRDSETLSAESWYLIIDTMVHDSDMLLVEDWSSVPCMIPWFLGSLHRGPMMKPMTGRTFPKWSW